MQVLPQPTRARRITAAANPIRIPVANTAQQFTSSVMCVPPRSSGLMRQSMRVTFAFALVMLFVGEVFPERCAVTDGCIGEVRYMHIPKGQRDTAKIFTTPGLPKVSDHAVLKERGYAFSDHALADPRLPGELTTAVESDAQLPWGVELNIGAEVQILGYRVFPELKELFARVLVLCSGSAP
jgi:hypothetical protein